MVDRKHTEGSREHRPIVVTSGPIRLNIGFHSLIPARCDSALFYLRGPCNRNVKTEAERRLKMLLDLKCRKAPGAKDVMMQLALVPERQRQGFSLRALEVGWPCQPLVVVQRNPFQTFDSRTLRENICGVLSH